MLRLFNGVKATSQTVTNKQTNNKFINKKVAHNFVCSLCRFMFTLTLNPYTRIFQKGFYLRSTEERPAHWKF
jgi:hypothetical protein